MSEEAFGDIRLFGFQFDEASSVVADFATTQCLKNPTVANFAIVELVANCDKSGRWELNLVASVKEAA
jgi:hypothetical protein